MLRTRLIAGPTASFVLSAVFGAIIGLVSQLDVVLEPFRVDPERPAPVTLRIPAHDLVVARGAIVTSPEERRIIRAYEGERRPPTRAKLAGLWVSYFLAAYIFLSYLRAFTGGRGTLLRTQAGLLVLTGLFCVVAKLLLLFTTLPPYVFPLATVPLWATMFFDKRTAIATGVLITFVSASFVFFSMPVVAVYLATTLGVVVFFHDRKHTTHMLVAGSAAGLFAAAVFVSLQLAMGREIDVMADLSMLDRSLILSTVAGGVISGVLALVLQRGATFALGVVTRSRLLELTDVDHPLLQKMATEAPGSWQHSRAMANLAESAAAAIGADALLTRVGAYFHDLGKTIQPKYFVENLDAGERSPHDALPPDVSADAIMAHVVEGARILRDGGIPEPIVEFAYTHHGTSVIEYFWHKCLEQGNPKGLSDAAFRYPGMRPRTKETAILMLIDSIEAAARTVDEPSRNRFQAIVQRVMHVKLQQGQLDQCGLTMVDLRILGTSLTDTLVKAYHNRIKYPWQDREELVESKLPVPGVATERDVARERSSREST